jgi:hypothetical protein
MKRKKFDQYFDIESIIEEISDILKNNFKKPIINQNKSLYYNIFNGIDTDTLLKIYKNTFVQNIFLFNNQYSLVLQINVNEHDKKIKIDEKESLDIKLLLNIEKNTKFIPPKFDLGKCSENVYDKLNDILKIVLFYLYNDKICVISSKYVKKPPFIIINIFLDLKSQINFIVLKTIKKIKKKIKKVYIKFNTIEKKMVLSIKVLNLI